MTRASKAAVGIALFLLTAWPFVTHGQRGAVDGAGLFSSGPQGGGRKFRALDKKRGRTIFEMELPGNETGLPMTYMMNGRQFIVVATGSRGAVPELIALALPEKAAR
jgi:glucose dehydrogenase